MSTAAIETTPSTQLMKLDDLTPAQLFAPGAVDQILARIKAEARAEADKLDISTEGGRKAIASLAYKVARTKTFVDQQRLNLVSDQKKRLAAIDAEGKRIREELDALKDEVRKPLTEWEEAEQSRIEKHEAEIMALENALDLGLAPTSVEIAARIMELEARDLSSMQEFTKRAELAKANSLTTLRERLEISQKADAERAELTRLRKEQQERERKEREEAIATKAREEAEAKAKQEAEAERQRIEQASRAREDAERAAKDKAIREKQEAEAKAAKAEADRLAAIEQAKLDAARAAEQARLIAAKAERDRITAEEKAKAEQEAAIQREREQVAAAKKAEEEAEAKREANRRHRAKINREALNGLVAAGITEETGRTVIELIAKGQVPNVKISY